MLGGITARACLEGIANAGPNAIWYANSSPGVCTSRSMAGEFVGGAGTGSFKVGSFSMNESMPNLMENSVQIAWDYLEHTGELGDAAVASRFLMNTVEAMIRQGERRRLFLSNKAIKAYQNFVAERTLTVVQ